MGGKAPLNCITFYKGGKHGRHICFDRVKNNAERKKRIFAHRDLHKLMEKSKHSTNYLFYSTKKKKNLHIERFTVEREILIGE